jgi:hypothetical protein
MNLKDIRFKFNIVMLLIQKTNIKSGYVRECSSIEPEPFSWNCVSYKHFCHNMRLNGFIECSVYKFIFCLCSFSVQEHVSVI